MARIAIIGAHGKVALRLERLLADRGDHVSGIIRNPDHAADVSAAGATPIVADIEPLDVDALARLLSGQDAVVWSAGAGGGDPARTLAVDREAAIRSMQAAEQAGVERYVMVSYFGSPDRDVPSSNPFHTYAEAKADADEHLASTTLRWTILGPSKLTDAPAVGAIDTNASAGTEVSRDDVAAVVAAALADDGTIGRTIRFNTGATPIAEALRG
ncbi:SDR family oxidoreductase [Agromyces sp. LHK192]|uniref:SDR family oxidoreductase n=1 Tax=Agromyces sp. LHK192 TaxID=2498704 RepID=UPI000FD98AF4|nr:SDR family oxidoreductase [Agromyces sp. LHK192]